MLEIKHLHSFTFTEIRKVDSQLSLCLVKTYLDNFGISKRSNKVRKMNKLLLLYM